MIRQRPEDGFPIVPDRPLDILPPPGNRSNSGVTKSNNRNPSHQSINSGIRSVSDKAPSILKNGRDVALVLPFDLDRSIGVAFDFTNYGFQPGVRVYTKKFSNGLRDRRNENFGTTTSPWPGVYSKTFKASDAVIGDVG